MGKKTKERSKIVRPEAVATREAVFNAADQLHRQYITTSAPNVRTALGGGSFATINRYLNEWFTARSAGVEASYGTLPNDVIKVTDDLWRLALTRADERFAAERAAFEGEAERLRAEVLRLAGDLDEAQKRIASLAQSLEQTRGLLSQRDQEVASERATSQERQAALLRLESQYAEHLRASEQQLNQARADRKAAEDSLDVEHQRTEERAAAYRKAVSAVEAKFDEAVRQHQKDKADWARRESVLQARLESAQEARDRFGGEKKELIADLNAANGEIRGNAEKISSLTAELKATLALLSQAHGEIEVSRTMVAQRDQSQMEYARHLGELEGTVSELRAQLARCQEATK